MNVHRKDQTTYRIDEKGRLSVPYKLLQEAGLEAKMRVYIAVKGKTLLIEKAHDVENPLDGDLDRNLDKDLFAKIHEQQQRQKERLLGEFGDRVEKAAEDDEPPAHPFRQE